MVRPRGTEKNCTFFSAIRRPRATRTPSVSCVPAADSPSPMYSTTCWRPAFCSNAPRTVSTPAFRSTAPEAYSWVASASAAFFTALSSDALNPPVRERVWSLWFRFTVQTSTRSFGDSWAARAWTICAARCIGSPAWLADVSIITATSFGRVAAGRSGFSCQAKAVVPSACVYARTGLSVNTVLAVSSSTFGGARGLAGDTGAFFAVMSP